MILLTGATGFIGAAIYRKLLENSFDIRPVVRSSKKDFFELSFVVEDFNASVDWSYALEGIDVVIHCAAQAHNKGVKIDIEEINYLATLKLAEAAAKKNVRRFIYLSSIGVNGGQTFGVPFKAEDRVFPNDRYSISKYKAELGLKEIEKKTSMEVVIIRPPLVYGLDAPGNFGRLVSAIHAERWLPFGLVNNKRTFVGLDNLVSLIYTCIDHPRAAGEVFLAGDAEDISTTDLLMRIGDVVGKKAKLLRVPVGLMRAGASVFGKKELINKICGDLQVDISKNHELLGWRPPISLEEGLRKITMEKH